MGVVPRCQYAHSDLTESIGEEFADGHEALLRGLVFQAMLLLVVEELKLAVKDVNGNRVRRDQRQHDAHERQHHKDGGTALRLASPG